MKLTKEQIEKIEVSDRDYYTCADCGQDQVNISYDAGTFLCSWCNNGCQWHGDIFYSPNRKWPRMVKTYVLNYITANEIIDKHLLNKEEIVELLNKRNTTREDFLKFCERYATVAE